MADPASSACTVLASGLCMKHEVDVGTVVTIAIFVIGYFVNAQIDRNKTTRDRHNDLDKQKQIRLRYLAALREEVAINVESLQKSIDVFPHVEQIRTFLRADKGNRPVITFNYYSLVLKTKTEILQELPDTLLRSLIEFYGKLEEIGLDTAAIAGPAFPTISNDGRESLVVDLLQQQKLALEQGKAVRAAIVTVLDTPQQQSYGSYLRPLFSTQTHPHAVTGRSPCDRIDGASADRTFRS